MPWKYNKGMKFSLQVMWPNSLPTEVVYCACVLDARSRLGNVLSIVYADHGSMSKSWIPSYEFASYCLAIR